MAREDVVYTYKDIVLSHKKEILPFAMAKIELESTMLSKITQS